MSALLVHYPGAPTDLGIVIRRGPHRYVVWLDGHEEQVGRGLRLVQRGDGACCVVLPGDAWATTLVNSKTVDGVR